MLKRELEARNDEKAKGLLHITAVALPDQPDLFKNRLNSSDGSLSLPGIDAGVSREETRMTLAETIFQHSLRLPESAAREALAFIENLEKRYSAVPSAPAAPDDTEAFLAAVAGTLGDDFPDDIADDDLGIDAPREALD
ncbi:MAG: hypothetical protein R6X17_07710 [Candidatus Competibacteraceae bacterium]